MKLFNTFHKELACPEKVRERISISAIGVETVQPHPWQAEAFKLQKKAKFARVNVLTGGGKTVYAKMLASSKLQENPKLKVVVAVPQTQIGFGFLKSHKFKGIRREWHKELDLCSDPSAESNRKRLKQFFKEGLNVAVITHATLCAAWEDIQDSVNENTYFIIDEAHHIQSSEYLDNCIGHCLKASLEKGAGALLLTATYFRGDRLSILPEKYAKDFVAYSLPIDVYLEKYAQGFKSFDYHFSLLDSPEYGRYIKGLGAILKEKKKTIIYLPPRQTNWAHPKGGKLAEVKLIIEQIVGRKVTKKEVAEDSRGVIKIDGLTIIDLVDEEGRDTKKQTIGDGIELDADYIIALGMFKEGANWTDAERAIICGPRGSVVDVIQIVGRVLREPKKGTKSPEIVQLFSNPKGRDNSEVKEWINDSLKWFAASLILEQQFSPVTVLGSKGEPRVDKGGRPTDFLVSVTGADPEKIHAIIDKLEKLMLDDEDSYAEEAEDWLKSQGYEGELDMVAKQVWAMNERRTKALVKVKDVLGEVDMIDAQSHPMGWMGVLSGKKFAALREAFYHGEKASLEEHIALIKEYGLDTPAKYDAFIKEHRRANK